MFQEKRIHPPMVLPANRTGPRKAVRNLAIGAALALAVAFLPGCQNINTKLAAYERARNSAQLSAQHTNEGYARMQAAVTREAERVTTSSIEKFERALELAGDSQAKVNLAWIAYTADVDKVRAWYEYETRVNEDWRGAGLALAGESIRQYEMAQAVLEGMSETGRYFAERGFAEAANVIEAANARALAKAEEKAKREQEREAAKREAEAAAALAEWEHGLAEREAALETPAPATPAPVE